MTNIGLSATVTMGKNGYCTDKFCDEPDETTELFRYNGKWVCGQCMEDGVDEDEFSTANSSEW